MSVTLAGIMDGAIISSLTIKSRSSELSVLGHCGLGDLPFGLKRSTFCKPP